MKENKTMNNAAANNFNNYEGGIVMATGTMTIMVQKMTTVYKEAEHGGV